MEGRTNTVKKIVVATKNAGKVKEIRTLLAGLPFEVVSPEILGDIAEPEETGNTFDDNAILKAEYYAAHTGMACLADDSGLEVDALGGAPGVYSARYAGIDATDDDNNARLLRELSKCGDTGRVARFCCSLAFCDDNGETILTRGICEGEIITEPRGTAGFGYDPLFYMAKYKKTLAEMSVAEKNLVSHRGKALRLMVDELKRYMERQ